MTLESSDLISCAFCTNCPPEGGECLHGFKREVSLQCDICPDGVTDINNSCVYCPRNPFLSFLLSFLVLPPLLLIMALLYSLRNTRFVRSIEPQANQTNLIRAKQIGAALSILIVFAALSPNLSDWFIVLANIISNIYMPFQLKPVCTSFYEEIVRGDYYFLKAWMAFVFIYAVSFFFRYAYKLKKRNRQLLFDISTLVNFQKLAALLMIQAPIMVLPMAFDSERMASIVAQNNNKLHIAILHSAVSILLLTLLLHFTIRRGSQHFKEIRKKLLEADVINPEETIEDLKNQGPYYASYCLQYAPSE